MTGTYRFFRCGTNRTNGGLPCIGADNFEAGRVVTDHVLSLGRHDVAYLFPTTIDNDRARNRLAGALFAANSQAQTPLSRRVLSCPYELGLAKDLAIDLLGKGRPDAFVCGNDVIAHGVLYACRSLGINVPNEVSVVEIGDFRGSREMEPGLTTVRMPARKIGELGATTLVEISETGMLPRTPHRKVDLRLIVRGSSREA